MPASLRIEIFPSDLQRMIDFYSSILGFTLIKHQGEYAYLRRDAIFIGAIEVPSSETLEEKARYRQPNKGIEIVIEVDDLESERDSIVDKGWKLDADIHSQPWGLRDFRLVDPDGYYLRITTHSPKRDGTGVAEI
jgi:lactoylglutathione lyase